MAKIYNMIQQLNIEYTLICFFFLLSMYNKWTLIISLCLSLILLKNGPLGVIQLLYLTSIRSMLSSCFNFSGSSEYLNMMRMFLLYGGGSFFLLRYFKKWMKSYTIARFLLATIILTIMFIVISVCVSVNRLVSIIAILNYFCPLMITVLLIYNVKNEMKLIYWLSGQVCFLIVSSLPFIFVLQGYSHDRKAFQGILSHPNLYATILVIGLVIIIVSDILKHKTSIKHIFMISLGFLQLIMTDCRTAIIVLTVGIFVTLVIAKGKKRFKYPSIALIIALIITTAINSTMHHLMLNFILKGRPKEEMLFTRNAQIENVHHSLDTHPFFGNGFGISSHGNDNHWFLHSFEDGNIIFELIIFTGIIGLTLFTIYVLHLFLLARSPFRLTFALFLITLLANLIIVILFDSNNIGILCNILWGIYLKDGITGRTLQM